MRLEVSKIEAIERIEPPKTKKEVRTFLDMTGYYRRFIPDYSTMAAPFTDMTHKTQPNQVEWTQEGVAAFERLKTALCAAPVLKTPDFMKESMLQTDASDRGVGAVLSQKAEDGGDRQWPTSVRSCCQGNRTIPWWRSAWPSSWPSKRSCSTSWADSSSSKRTTGCCSGLTG